MIVVHRRMSALPSTKSTITFSSSSPGIWPWPTPMRALGHELAQLARPLVDVLDAVVHEEHLPAARQLALDAFDDDARRRSATTVVRMARRSAGGVVMIDRSRSPISAMCSVRGIGVAVSVSTSTCVRSFLRRSLCVTPKRCSSSTTTSPRSLKRTSFDKQAVRADDDVDLARRRAP